MNKLFLFFTAIILYSCKGNGSSETVSATDTAGQTIHANATDTLHTGAKPIALNGCYQMTLKRDTATLQLHLKDSTITGNLRYNWYEKDGNTGTINGVLRGELIYADYTFESDGLTSVREVVFKIKNDTLLQAYGDLAEQNEKIVFKDKSRLQFPTEHRFIKIACP